MKLTRTQARRLALRAQGLPRPTRTPSLTATVQRLHAIQIDSVNVLTRAHYLPFFSRLGDYDRQRLDHLTHSRTMTEYWAHEASLMPNDLRAYFGWRMRRWQQDGWGFTRRVEAEHPGLMDKVLAEIDAGGPGTARDVERRLAHDAPRSGGDWGWNWSAVKQACEALFWAGEITTTGRTTSFERTYDMPAPRADIPDEQALDELVARSVVACGIADATTIRDYFRLPADLAKPALQRVVASGRIQPVEIRGMPGQYYTIEHAQPGRRRRGACLLGPFDNFLWHRDRVEQLFDFRYRIEIYVPADKRQYGYYVLPFLLDESLTARVDLKADRQAGRLLVRGAYAEPDAPADTASALIAELHLLASWLDLTSIEIADRGDLAGDVRALLT